MNLLDKLPWKRLPRYFVKTHDTAGLPGFPAIDNFAKPGTLIFPPEKGTLVWPHMIEWDRDKAIGGGTIYLIADSGNTYYLTHFDFSTLRKRTRIQRWHPIGRVAAVPCGWWEPHIHEGKHKGIYNPLT